ncbi:MAG: GerMN domain-containing protein [Candidatus Paceibacteria bacterium]
MQRNTSWIIAGGFILIIGVTIIWLQTREVPVTINEDQDIEMDFGQELTPTVDSVLLAMLNVGDDGEGERHGCDFLTFVEQDIVPTTAPLTAAMQALFALDSANIEGHYNFIANTKDTLQFERAEIDNGTAHIYLTGELSGLSGVCSDPRASIQIKQTALQFETVNNVELYLDSEPTSLVPSQQ